MELFWWPPSIRHVFFFFNGDLLRALDRCLQTCAMAFNPIQQVLQGGHYTQWGRFCACHEVLSVRFLHLWRLRAVSENALLSPIRISQIGPFSFLVLLATPRRRQQRRWGRRQGRRIDWPFQRLLSAAFLASFAAPFMAFIHTRVIRLRTTVFKPLGIEYPLCLDA